MDRYLVLKDGAVFRGRPLGADVEAAGEVVFNTGMTGYQEILTDPSYAGQIVLLTYPIIGNYGINDDDFESDRVQPAALIVREACEAPSNWRSRRTLHEFLVERGLGGLQGVDTRAITKRLRSAGVTMGLITDADPERALQRLADVPDYGDQNFVELVSTPAPYAWGYEGREDVDAPQAEYRHKIVVLDCGLKFNILRRLAALGCRSVVLPHSTGAEQVLGWKPDGVLLSPGPGDPGGLTQVMKTVRGLVGKVPMFGVCLGNQMVACALGGSTFKLKFGHRGSNHPVKDLATGKVAITSQNHGYAVDADSLTGTGVEVTQINLNDGTVEGLQHEPKGVFSIQYHPEAAPGPLDSRPYFQEFINRIESAGT
ncbi:MAG: glutamine-hydrolyzing carbamoyl-phosphate synthase small subunit [Armatimonadetes bacterium]|nr:glutamine-hydrolyzing carbamoyl-phosphate synthase small subunit [Armatimonadota bacterium]